MISANNVYAPLNAHDLFRLELIILSVSTKNFDMLHSVNSLRVDDDGLFWNALHEFERELRISFSAPPNNFLDFSWFTFVECNKMASFVVPLWSGPFALTDVSVYTEIFCDEEPRVIWLKDIRIP